MKEKILQKIKESLGTTQLSDRTLMEVAVNFLSTTITNDELLTDEVIAPEVARLKVMEGQLNHEVAEKLKSQPKPQPPKPEPKAQPLELPKEIQEELDANRKFREEFLKQQQQTQLKAKREQLLTDVKKGLGDAGCKDEIMVRLALAQIDYEKDAEANIGSLKNVYDAELSNYVSKQGYIPSSSQETTATPKTKDEIAAEQKAQVEQFKKQGLIN